MTHFRTGSAQQRSFCSLIHLALDAGRHDVETIRREALDRAHEILDHGLDDPVQQSDVIDAADKLANAKMTELDTPW